ncbi:sulfite exporter TauE/SafE family protein [Candidatus Curtissbacteria bacterium]|nr:sulfite exporter TauE/SafE family protein [Candidatus Curtissbacteria bacterium]
MNIGFLAAAVLAEVLGTMAGFGSSTLLFPFAVLFFDFRTAIVLVAFFHLFGNLSRIGFFKHGLDRGLLFKFGIPSVLLSLTGALLVAFIDQETLKGILGLFLIFYSIEQTVGKSIKLKMSFINLVLGGGLSGFLAGLIGAGGALRATFLTAFGLPKEKYLATAAAVAIGVDLARIPAYLRQGFLSEGYFWYLPVLLILAILGTFLGRQVVIRIPVKLFRLVVLVAITLVGMKFVYDWIF